MAFGRIIVEKTEYRFEGESNAFYGYFNSHEQAGAWVQENCPNCEIVEENREYQTSTLDGCTTWIIHDLDNESFKRRCAIMELTGHQFFDESEMLPIE